MEPNQTPSTAAQRLRSDEAALDDVMEQIAALMKQDGVDLGDSQAVRAWVESMGFADDDDVEPVQFRKVLLAPVSERAAIARESGTVIELLRLVDWLGPGKSVDEVEDLSIDDAHDAAVEIRLLSAEQLEVRRQIVPDDVDAVPEFSTLWDLALTAGVVAAVDGTVTRAKLADDLASKDDEAILAAWLVLFKVEMVRDMVDFSDELDADSVFAEEWPNLLAAAYEDGWLNQDEAHEMLGEAVDDILDPDEGEDEEVKAAWDLLDDAIDVYARLGVVVHDHESLTLTPLGRWAVREMLVEDGHDAPVAEEMEDLDLAEMLVAQYEVAPEDWAAFRARWVARHGPERYARELLELAAAEDAWTERSSAFVLLDDVDTGSAVAAVRDALTVPGLRRHATKWLLSHGYDAPALDEDDEAWVHVDSFAAVVDGIQELGQDPGPHVTEMLSDPIVAAQHEQLLPRLYRCDHPHTAAVLTVIGRSHPDRRMAKETRRAAFRTRSRPATTSR